MTTQAASAVLAAPREPCRGTPAEEIDAPFVQVRSAAKAAGAHAFISELPEGYHTPVGDGGVILTPSQRVRLAVARLSAADPPSLLLDNPTAGLDAAGEAAVLPGLEALMRNREVVLVGASPAVSAAAARAASYGPGSDARTPAPTTSRLRADRDLPQLPQLLDAQAMAPVLGRRLVGGGIPDVRVQSVRYKPGDNVVVQYDVATPGGWSTAVAYASATSGVKRKRERKTNRELARRVVDRTPARKPLSYDREVRALVQWLPLDVRLPLLSEDGRKLGKRLAKAGLTDVSDAEPEFLRYWARRRAVLRLGPHVLKVYRDASDFTDAERGLRASAGLRNVRTAACEAVLPGRLVTVQALLPGDSPSMWPRASEAAGGLLADLHADTILPLLAITPDVILAKSANRADFVGQLLPELRGELDSLLAELTSRTPSGLPWVTSHGNFHAGQLLAGPGGLAMIDVDRLCLAAPAYDLASFAAHVAFGHPGELDLVTATLDSLLAGYRARPRALEWFLATCLLRRTAVPFRHQDEHWPEAMAALVACARSALR